MDIKDIKNRLHELSPSIFKNLVLIDKSEIENLQAQNERYRVALERIAKLNDFDNTVPYAKSIAQQALTGETK